MRRARYPYVTLHHVRSVLSYLQTGGRKNWGTTPKKASARGDREQGLDGTGHESKGARRLDRPEAPGVSRARIPFRWIR
ncbi:protein of unknown function [Pararobbsia alpina]